MQPVRAGLFLGVAHVALVTCEIDVSQRHAEKCRFGENTSISLNVPSGSRCCSAVEIYLARRKGGYCPTFASHPPYMKCSKSLEFGGRSMPDKATVGAAAHEICGLAGCAAALQEFSRPRQVDGYRRYQDKWLDRTTLPNEPNCHTVGKEDGHKYVVSVEKAAISSSMLLATLLLIVIGHQKLTPKWIANSMAAMARARAAAEAARSKSIASPATGSLSVSSGNKIQCAARAASMASTVLPIAAAKDAATLEDKSGADDVRPISPELQVIDRPESPELIDVQIEDDVIISGPDALDKEDKVPCSPLSFQEPVAPRDSNKSDVSSPQSGSKSSDPRSKSPDPIANLLTARSRCKAHFGLFRCSSIVFTIGRLALAVPYASRGDHFFVVVALCSVYQFLIVLQQGTPDFSQEHAMHGCSVGVRDLRGFAYSTVLVEAFVLFSVALGAVLEDDGHVFFVQQVSLDLVLVRFYVAWLALGLRRHIIALTFAVVPEEEEPQEPGCPVDQLEPAASAPRSAFDALVPAWPAPEEDFVEPVKGLKKLTLWWRVCLLVSPTLLAVGAVGVWMVVSKETKQEELSSCRTSMRGVDFCVPTEFIEQPVDVKSIDECCKSCDATSKCTAWTFAEADDSGAGSCWRLHFTDAPCDERPGHLSCRCHTSSDRHGGFKPKKGDIIWHSDG